MLHGYAFRGGVFNTNIRAQTYPSREPIRRLPVTPLSATSSGSDGGAGGGDNPEALPAAPSLREAYSLLGLKEGSSYETVLDAKNRLMERYQGQREKLKNIELAYDTIFSSQLKARLSGDLPVSNKVRFADVAPPRRQVGASKPLTLPGNAVAVRKLPKQAAVTTSAVFAALAAWTLAQGILWPGPGKADVPGLQLALGTAAALYALREGKKVQLGKSVGIAFAGLVIGALVGSGVESWLRVDLIPLGSLSSPPTVVSEFALLGLWGAVFFLA